MTVAELIAALQQHDPDLPVLVDGFDHVGYDDVKCVQAVRYWPEGRQPWTGPHGDAEDAEVAERADELAPALWLVRRDSGKC